MQALAILFAAVVVGTWNGKWFPSGDSEHRAAPEVEARTIAEAGKLLRRGLDAVDPLGTNDVILCLNEIRGPKSAVSLCAAIGRTNLALAVITGYRRRDRFDMQQDAILTTLPVAAKGWSAWKAERRVRPTRGYAHADLVLAPSVTASVYAVHLKSNYGATDRKKRADNTAQRSAAVRQFVAMEKPRRGRTRGPVLLAGDFNADPWRAEFKDETLFAELAEARFSDILALLPPAARGTHPSVRYGDSALDHLLVRDFVPLGPPVILPAGVLSDHNPVFAVLTAP